jgi:sugar lactone lactonase YvrE
MRTIMDNNGGFTVSDVEHILAVHNELGEGPLWDADEQVLYWVDINNQCYFRFNPATSTHEKTEVGVKIGVLALRASGGMVMAVRDGFAFWDTQKQALSYIARPQEKQPQVRFNDGAVDCGGRFWAGTMNEDEDGAMLGTLWRLDPDGSVHAMETNVGTSNGIGWSPDNKTMYFTDSRLHIIYAYDFDAASGDVANRRTFVHTPDERGVPDGLTVDSEGFVWSARWDGAKIVRYDPGGKIERVIETPALRTTACVFGGANMDELYITSAWVGLSLEQKEQYLLSGDLFRVKTGIKGQKKYKFGG